MEFLVGLVPSQEERGGTRVKVVAARVCVEKRMRKTSACPLYIGWRQPRDATRVTSP
jgi:hypothetical protein